MFAICDWAERTTSHLCLFFSRSSNGFLSIQALLDEGTKSGGTRLVHCTLDVAGMTGLHAASCKRWLLPLPLPLLVPLSCMPMQSKMELQGLENRTP